MRYIFSQEQLVIPEGVTVHIRSRIVTVEGPRGKLTKDLSHIAVTFTLPKNTKGQDVIQIEIHHGSRKNVATLRTVKSIIENLITGVTKGYKYKMRYVYAHFPINVNVEKVDDRYEGVEVETSKGVKDQIELWGNSVENVSQSAADIQQICRVRNKDIRKFLDGLYVSEKGNVVEE
ncbi:hypothetical protein DV735_g4244, partial [Chaetothyriales sp. CBS 134920]